MKESEKALKKNRQAQIETKDLTDTFNDHWKQVDDFPYVQPENAEIFEGLEEGNREYIFCWKKDGLKCGVSQYKYRDANEGIHDGRFKED